MSKSRKFLLQGMVILAATCSQRQQDFVEHLRPRLGPDFITPAR